MKLLLAFMRPHAAANESRHVRFAELWAINRQAVNDLAKRREQQMPVAMPVHIGTFVNCDPLNTLPRYAFVINGKCRAQFGSQK